MFSVSPDITWNLLKVDLCQVIFGDESGSFHSKKVPLELKCIELEKFHEG